MAGRFAPIATPYLGNSSIVGYSSDTSWYMLADPGSSWPRCRWPSSTAQTPTIESQERRSRFWALCSGATSTSAWPLGRTCAIKVEATG